MSKKVYYHVEIPLETVKLLTAVCDSFGSIVAGDANAFRDIVLNAYEKRIGRKATDNVKETISELSKQLVSFGWDTNIGTRYAHRYSKESDTLFDVKEVLTYQMSLRGETDTTPREPIHWNKDIELPRVVKIIETSAVRKKQLRIVPH